MDASKDAGLVPALQFEKRAGAHKMVAALAGSGIAADLARVRGYSPMPQWADERAGGWFLLVASDGVAEALHYVESLNADA